MFNPDTYEASSGSNTFDTVTGQWLIHNTGSYAYSKFGQVVELDPTKTYIYSVSYKYIVKNGSMPFLQYYNGQKFVNCSYPDTTSGTDSWYNYTLEFKPSSNCYVFSNGKVKMLIGLTTGNLGSNTYFTNFYLYEKTDSSKKNLFINSDFNHGLYGWTSAGYDDKAISQYGVMSTKFGEIELLKYYNQQAVSEDFVVNIYGNKLSVLNFDWYMPYKHYGDICVIAFCYLAFIWHTFKRLPNII